MGLKHWLIKNNVEKLYALFMESKDSEDIKFVIDRLIENSGIEYLKKIFFSKKSVEIELKKTMINYLIKKISSPNELYEIYLKSDSLSKQKIFEKLVKLNADEILWKIYDSEKLDSNLLDLDSKK
jgi:hypothetical protein